MASQNNLVYAGSIEELFFFQGFPVEGFLYAFSNTNRSQAKSLVSQTSELPLPNPTQISNGKLLDDNDDSVVPIGLIVDENGNFESYYLEVRLNDGATRGEQTLVESRENWPFGADSSSSEVSNAENFITNGQFALNTTPVFNSQLTGQISQSETAIATGGWYFLRPDSSVATDFVTFFRYPQYFGEIGGTARYAVQIQNTAPDATDQFKALSVRFNNVNTFASADQEYTLAFLGETLDGSSRDITFSVYRDYGTGGTVSPSDESIIATFELTATSEIKQTSFVFGIPDGSSIGTNNDDYIELRLSFDPSTTFNVRLGSFVLYQGATIVANFPVTTQQDFAARASFIDAQPTDNQNLYLPTIRTAKGWEYDFSSIGRVESYVQYQDEPSISTTTNLITCDGGSYPVDGFSPLGIPYERLWARSIFDLTNGTNQYGNGSDFIEAACFDPEAVANNNFFVSANTIGFSAPLNGVSPFVFTETYNPTSTINTFMEAFFGTLLAESALNLPIVAFIGDPGNVALNVTPPAVGTVPGIILETQTLILTPNFYIIFTIPVSPSAAGTYFTFSNSLNQNFYVWYTVDGVGTDPAIAGATGLQVNLLDTWTANQMAIATKNAVRGTSSSNIQFTNGAALSGGEYWTFECNAGDYYIWCTVDGSGTDPNVAGRSGILVDLLSTDTDQEVAFKFLRKINSIFFAVPDYRGLFLRGSGLNLVTNDIVYSDSGISPRIIFNYNQMQSFATHAHSAVTAGGTESNFFIKSALGTFTAETTSFPNGQTTYAAGGLSSLNPNTQTEGGVNTRPQNTTITYKIRY